MKKILVGLLFVSGMGCHSMTLIGAADAAVDQVSCNVTFPAKGFYGPNLLAPGNESLISTEDVADRYEFVVQHDATALVTVMLTSLSGPGIWYIGSPLADWHATLWDGSLDAATAGSQTFQAPSVSGEFEESIFFTLSGRARLDTYECGASTPAISKTISWSPPDGGVSPADASVVVLDGGFLGDDASSQPPPPVDGGIVIPPGGRD